MRRLLITGGCGFIGVNLIDYLRRTTRELDIVVIDDLSLGRRKYIEPYGVDFIEGDLRDDRALALAMDGVSEIVHLAANTRVIESIGNPVPNFEVNVVGTFKLLEAARSAGIERFVFASTGGAIIGNAVPPVHEGIVPRPVSPYGASKLCGEGYLSAYFGAYGMPTTSLRFSNVYGPRSYHKGSVVAQFLKNVLQRKAITVFGDGSQTRDYVFVDDICAAIVAVLDGGKAGEVYQLGSGVPTSVTQILDLIKTTIKPYDMPAVRYAEFRPGEVVHTHTRIDKAREDLGYSPQVSLADGMARTWSWFLANSSNDRVSA